MLELDNNKFTTLPENFRNLKNSLTSLSINNNRLTRLLVSFANDIDGRLELHDLDDI
jgi:Leucine-rich repeat (LRR) protein